MIEIGKKNQLCVVKELDFGLYLDGDEWGEILLPRRYVPEVFEIGEPLEVFLYFDSEDRIIATTETPHAEVGQFAMLRVTETNRIGAFLDWGLAKDLLVPFREQKVKMVEGRSYLVYIYVDPISPRIVASAKVEQFLDTTIPNYEFKQVVDIIPFSESDLGYRVIIENLHTGLLYHSEVPEPLYKGDHYEAYVRRIRPDGKIDLTMRQPGYERIGGLADEIVRMLEENDAYLPLTDRSSPEVIEEQLGCSKKDFKKAIGALYKAGAITITPSGIRLNLN